MAFPNLVIAAGLLAALPQAATTLALPPQDAFEGVIRVSAGLTSPTVISSVGPTYSREARDAKVQGQVVLEIVIDAEGAVSAARVIRSLDRERGLDAAAIAAARQWRFSPARDREGQPIAVIATLELSFRLDENGIQAVDATDDVFSGIRLLVSVQTNPQPISTAKPVYTPEGRAAKVEGIVTLEAVVLPDGSIGDVRVIGSLDRDRGLDGAAIAAAKQWRFFPALDLARRPVPAIVQLELSFRLTD